MTGCPIAMHARAWQCLKGMSECRTAGDGVGASSLGSSFWVPFSLTAVTYCTNQWNNPQLAQTVLLPLTNLPEHTLPKTGLSGSQQAQWFCIHGCEISFHCWVAFFLQLLTVQLVLAAGGITICGPEGSWHREKGNLRGLNIWSDSWESCSPNRTTLLSYMVMSS